MNAQLQAEIGRRRTVGQELRLANQALLDRVAELKAYEISDDLRAPLRHIDGYATILQQQCGPLLDSTGRRYIGRIVDSARHNVRRIVLKHGGRVWAQASVGEGANVLLFSQEESDDR